MIQQHVVDSREDLSRQWRQSRIDISTQKRHQMNTLSTVKVRRNVKPRRSKVLATLEASAKLSERLQKRDVVRAYEVLRHVDDS